MAELHSLEQAEDEEVRTRRQRALLDAFAGGCGVFAERPATVRYAYLVFKRAFDVAFSLFVTLVLLIPGTVLCAAIALDTKGSPIYVDRRVGRRGRDVPVLKFRTMHADADDLSKYLTAEQIAQWEVERKIDDDPRVTKIGSFLRGASLDELPQFLNVLMGQMSVVGPRPITRGELRWFGNKTDELLSCRPGITGMWQVLARNSATYETGVRQEMELTYVRRRSASIDLRILGKTFGAVFRRTGR